MRAYKAFDDGRIEELGDIPSSHFVEYIEAAAESLGGDSFGFGLMRSEKDFVEIRPVGNDQYLIWSDVLVRRKGLLSALFSRAHIEVLVDSRERALEAALAYENCPREEFERRYS